MDSEQARKMVRDLRVAGVTFAWRAFWYATGATISSSIDVATLPPDDWDCEMAATFPDLPETDPRFEFLDAVADLYHSSTTFSDALHKAAADIRGEEQEEEFLRAEAQADEALAAMDAIDRWATPSQE